MSEHRKITLIGTGLMGQPMARNLMAAGHALTVWNRTPDKVAPLCAEGAATAQTAAEAIAGAQVIITMLSDGYATQALLEGPEFHTALQPGMIWIDMCSARPEHARTQSAYLAKLGIAHLDAPVSGGTKGAQDASLAIMAGGARATFNEVEHVLRAMGRPVHVGPSGAGQLCKLANQTIVAVTIAAVAEATLLAQQGGADPAALRAALGGGFADSVILQQHGARMSQGDFTPGAPSRLQLKDLDNALEAAGALGLADMPAAQAARDRYARLVADMDGAELDHAALYLELKKRNGMI